MPPYSLKKKCHLVYLKKMFFEKKKEENRLLFISISAIDGSIITPTIDASTANSPLLNTTTSAITRFSAHRLHLNSLQKESALASSSNLQSALAIDLDWLFAIGGYQESTLIEIQGSLRVVLQPRRRRVKKRQRLSCHVVARHIEMLF